jgi:copper chaperone
MQFRIQNMTCGGCVRSVTKLIKSVDPAAEVNANPSTRKVDVASVAPRESIARVLADAGYAAS